MVRKRKSWREATIITRLDPDHWRAEYPGGGSGMFREADIRAYDPKPDATPAEQPPRAKATAPETPSRSRYAIGPEAIATGRLPQRAPVVTSAANPYYQKHFDRLFDLAQAGDWDGVRNYEVKGSNSYSKMVARYRQDLLAVHAASEAPDERARSTVALPRLVRRVAGQSSDTSALALPLGDARTKITFDYRPNQVRLLRRRRIYTSALAVDLPYRRGDLKCRGQVGEVSCAFLWCPARSIYRPPRHARNPFACTRCGNRRRPMWTRTICRIGVEGSRVLSDR
jgi:hypothetical protein